MTLVILGVLLWVAAHFFKRVAPEARARLGGNGKAIIAGVLFLSILLMIFGYRGADFIEVYSPPSWGLHLNNLLMVVAVILMGLGKSKSRLNGLTRHPMLVGVKVWAIAHLLVNGDLASIILFGGLFVWAILQIILINRAEPVWTKPKIGNLAGDMMLLVISVAVFTVLVTVHYLLGYPVFPG